MTVNSVIAVTVLLMPRALRSAPVFCVWLRAPPTTLECLALLGPVQEPVHTAIYGLAEFDVPF